ncbi:hypothetical protein [Flexivirga sp. B27]
MKGVRLFLKARAAGWLPALCMAAFVLSIVLPGSLMNVPLRDDVRAMPQLVIGVLPAGLSYLAMRPPSAVVERNPPMLRAARGLWWGVSAVLMALSSSIAMLDQAGTASEVMARNSFVMVGVSTLSAAVLGYEFGWAVPLAALGITLMFGTSSYDGTPQPWAILNQPATSMASWIAALLVTLIAWVVYSLRDVSERPMSLPRLFRLNS